MGKNRNKNENVVAARMARNLSAVRWRSRAKLLEIGAIAWRFAPFGDLARTLRAAALLTYMCPGAIDKAA
jgi:hypothetical protein